MKRVIFMVFAFSLLISACADPVQNSISSPGVNSPTETADIESATNVHTTTIIPEPVVSQSESNDNNDIVIEDDAHDSPDSNDTNNNDNYLVGPIDYRGYDDDFDRLFIDATNDSAFLDRIVGRDELSKFINEEIEPHKFEKQNLPLAYKIIQHFNIPKDVLIDYNIKAIIFNEEHGYEGTIYKDYIIDAFYCGDLDEMRRTLKSPYVLYQNQEFYTIYDLFSMELPEIAGLGLSRNELLSYTKKVHDVMKSYGYENEEHFSKLIEKIEQINP